MIFHTTLMIVTLPGRRDFPWCVRANMILVTVGDVCFSSRSDMMLKAHVHMGRVLAQAAICRCDSVCRSHSLQLRPRVSCGILLLRISARCRTLSLVCTSEATKMVPAFSFLMALRTCIGRFRMLCQALIDVGTRAVLSMRRMLETESCCILISGPCLVLVDHES